LIVCFAAVLLAALLGIQDAVAGGNDPYGNEDPNKKILKSGLLGAATGAIAAGASDGDAGTGALVGAGTSVVGGALLDALTTPSQPQPAYGYPQQGYAQPPPQQYAQQSYPQQQYQQGYYAPEARGQAYYPPPPPMPVREDPNKKILKSGLLGAATGAIAAGASDGDAGTGALVGAGTSVVGGALLDALTTPSQPQYQQPYYPPQQQYYPPQGYQQQPVSYQQQEPTKKIIRKYDSEGNIIEEQEVYQ